LSYSFLNLTSLYPDFLRDFYARNPGMTGESYSSQLVALRKANRGWSASMTDHLGKLGIETHEIYSNAEPAQRAWARENNFHIGDPLPLALAQVKAIRPQVLFLEDLQQFNGEFIERARKEVPELRLVLGLHCAAYDDELVHAFRPLNALITCSPGMQSHFVAAGLNSFLIYHAFDPRVLEGVRPSAQKRYGLLFAGSVNSGPGQHNQRRELLEFLSRSDLDIT
jgi:spore maturation protein CgeB